MPEQRLTDEQFQIAGQHLAELVEEFERLPYPAVQEMVFDLLQTIDALHREALTRLVIGVRASGGGEGIDRAAIDPVARTLLELYDLVEFDPRESAEAALDSVRGYLHSHGGEVEVVDVVNGVVHLRLRGACETCPASSITVNRMIESAIRAEMHGIRAIHVDEGQSETGVAGFVPLADIRRTGARSPADHVEAGRVENLPPGTMQGVQIGDERLLLANLGGDVVGYRDQCPGSVAPLSLGKLSAPIVVCPWHNDAFDLRTGARADGQMGSGLERVEIAVRDGVILAVLAHDQSMVVGQR